MVKLVCNNTNYPLQTQTPSLSSEMRNPVSVGPTLLYLGSPLSP